MKQTKKNSLKLCDTIKMNNIHIIGILEEEGVENYFNI